MPVTTNQRTSRCLFKWSADYGLDSNGKLWGLSGNKVVTATFDRGGTAGAASAVDANGRVFVPGYKTPLFHYINGTRYLLLQGSRINNLTYGRDLTNAAWTATTCTVARSTGADGVASSGSRLTATAGNGTVIRAAALVHASQARTGSFWVKRVTGTGNIDITLDNGATWTTITVTSSFMQVSKTQTLANSQFGIRIVTNGDAVDVDYTQNESGEFASSAIPTAGAAVTRARDNLKFLCGFAPNQAITGYVSGISLGWVYADSGNNDRLYQIGASATEMPQNFCCNTTGNVAVQSHQGATWKGAGFAVSGGVAIGDLCEARGVTNTDGSLICGFSKNSGTEQTGTNAGQTISATLTDPTIYVGQDDSVFANAFFALKTLKFAAGVQSLNTMRNL